MIQGHQMVSLAKIQNHWADIQVLSGRFLVGTHLANLAWKKWDDKRYGLYEVFYCDYQGHLIAAQRILDIQSRCVVFETFSL